MAGYYRCEVCKRKKARRAAFTDDGKELFVCHDCAKGLHDKKPVPGSQMPAKGNGGNGETKGGTKNSSPAPKELTRRMLRYVNSIIDLDLIAFTQRLQPEADVILCHIIDIWKLSGGEDPEYEGSTSRGMVKSKIKFDEELQSIVWTFTIGDKRWTCSNRVIYDFSDDRKKRYSFFVDCDTTYATGTRRREMFNFTLSTVTSDYWILLETVAAMMFDDLREGGKGGKERKGRKGK